jgi:hypothetical protein
MTHYHAAILLVVGLLLIALNELTVERQTKVVREYIPRDLDAWFKDPENQPLYMYTGTVFGDNVRV